MWYVMVVGISGCGDLVGVVAMCGVATGVVL